MGYCKNGRDVETGLPCSVAKRTAKLERTAKAGPLTYNQAMMVRQPGANVPYNPMNWDLRDDMNKDALVERYLAAGVRNRPSFKKGGFPDLTGDGKVTRADILKGRGVFRAGGMVGMPMYSNNPRVEQGRNLKYGGSCGKVYSAKQFRKRNSF
jgi:hypothetical protein